MGSKYLPMLIGLVAGFVPITLFVMNRAPVYEVDAIPAYELNGTVPEAGAVPAQEEVKQEPSAVAQNAAASQESAAAPAVNASLYAGTGYDRETYTIINPATRFSTDADGRTRVFTAARIASEHTTNVFFRCVGPQEMQSRTYPVRYNPAGYNIHVYWDLTPGEWHVSVIDADRSAELKKLRFVVE